jgi:Tfp pilus assembly protein PilO
MTNKIRQWSMFTAVAAVGILVVSWFLLISPQRSHAATLKTQVSAQQTQNAQLQTQVQQLEAQKADLPKEQRALENFDAQIPNAPNLPELIRDLSSAADKAGVTLVSIAPSQPTPVAAAVAPAPVAPATTTSTSTTDTGTTPVAPVAAPPLEKIAVDVNVQGSYYNIISFFQALESMKRVTLVSGLGVTPANGGSTSTVSSGGSGSGDSALPPGTLNGTVHAAVFEQTPTVSTATIPTTGAPAPAQ